MEQEILQLKKEVGELKRFVASLTNSATVPPDVSRVFRTGLLAAQAAKAANSENKSVNEGGSASYSVLLPPDGFDSRVDGATTKYYPYYT